MANETTTRPAVSSARLWFGLTASAAAWFALGVADVLITWWACVQEDPLSTAGTVRSGTGALYFIAALLWMGTAVAAGVTSYRTWRRLSETRRLSDAEGRGRSEFMALIGVFVSFTLGIGLIWLTVPVFILKLCVRAR